MNKKDKFVSEYRRCVYGLNDTLALFHFFYQSESDMCCILEDIETGIVHSFILGIGLRFLDTESYMDGR